jgi:hypothetical protein
MIAIIYYMDAILVAYSCSAIAALRIMDMWPPHASGIVFVWITIGLVKWFAQLHFATIVLV